MKHQRIETNVSRSILIGTLVYILFEWNHLPDIIPSHFNGVGEIDGYGAKSSVFIIFMFMAMIHVGFVNLKKNIEVRTLPISIQIPKNTHIHRVIFTMLTIAHFVCMFSILLLMIYAIRGTNLPSLFPCLMMIGIFLPIGIILIELIWKGWCEYGKM